MTDTDVTRAGDDRSTFASLRVTAVEHDPHDCVIVTFDTSDDADRFTFTHGQHVNLRREFDGIEVRRSYSICAVAPDGELRIAIREVPNGVFSTWATRELQPGDLVEVTPPAGHFTHELDPTARRQLHDARRRLGDHAAVLDHGHDPRT